MCIRDRITDVGHIERALKAKATRTGRVSARIIDDMLAGIILIDTSGAAVGKCNGLTVLEVGDSAFGVPARISATVYPGGSGIVDIEREVSLGQPIHSKGVMILSLIHIYQRSSSFTSLIGLASWLNSRWALRRRPRLRDISHCWLSDRRRRTSPLWK